MLNPAPRRSLPQDWNAARAAVVVCDMWDTAHCVTAARRVEEMAPRMNEVLHGLRARGALVVHAPDACMDFYAGTPQRLRAMRAPFVPVPYRIDWHTWEPDELAALPATLTSPGVCSCESPEPCSDTPSHGIRQTPLIDIAPEDVVTDDGQEFYNVLEEHGIADVLVTGVHLNIYVLGRPYGVRQLVYWGKRPVLCRDLTDAFHRGRGAHRAALVPDGHEQPARRGRAVPVRRGRPRPVPVCARALAGSGGRLTKPVPPAAAPGDGRTAGRSPRAFGDGATDELVSKAMPAIEVEPTLHKSHGPCPHCGGEEQTVWGWVHQGRRTHAAYYVRWTAGRRRDSMVWMLCVGPWGRGAREDDRRSIGLRAHVRWGRPEFMVVDATRTPWGRGGSPAFGARLTRAQVIDTPLAAEVFAYVDQIVAADPRVARFVATGEGMDGHGGPASIHRRLWPWRPARQRAT